MKVIVLFHVYQVVTFIRASAPAVTLMDIAIPMDMKIATTTTLALGYEVTGLTGFYKVGNQGKSSFRLQKPLSESEEILLGGAIVRQTRDNWVPEQDMEAVCSLADKSALTRQLYWMRIDAAQQS